MISMAATPIFHGRHDKYEHGEKRFKLEVAHEAKKGLRNSSALLSYGARRTVHPPFAAAAALPNRPSTRGRAPPAVAEPPELAATKARLGRVLGADGVTAAPSLVGLLTYQPPMTAATSTGELVRAPHDMRGILAASSRDDDALERASDARRRRIREGSDALGPNFMHGGPPVAPAFRARGEAPSKPEAPVDLHVSCVGLPKGAAAARSSFCGAGLVFKPPP